MARTMPGPWPERRPDGAIVWDTLGHTPFGIPGQTLNRLFPGGFRHNEHSLRVWTCWTGAGVEPHLEVRDGILSIRVRNSGNPGKVAWSACRPLAYINHDIDDACGGYYARRSAR